jgi:hypothetical protein
MGVLLFPAYFSESAAILRATGGRSRMENLKAIVKSMGVLERPGAVRSRGSWFAPKDAARVTVPRTARRLRLH